MARLEWKPTTIPNLGGATGSSSTARGGNAFNTVQNVLGQYIEGKEKETARDYAQQLAQFDNAEDARAWIASGQSGIDPNYLTANALATGNNQVNQLAQEAMHRQQREANIYAQNRLEGTHNTQDKFLGDVLGLGKRTVSAQDAIAQGLVGQEGMVNSALYNALTGANIDVQNADHKRFQIAGQQISNRGGVLSNQGRELQNQQLRGQINDAAAQREIATITNRALREAGGDPNRAIPIIQGMFDNGEIDDFHYQYAMNNITSGVGAGTAAHSALLDAPQLQDRLDAQQPLEDGSASKGIEQFRLDDGRIDEQPLQDWLVQQPEAMQLAVQQYVSTNPEFSNSEGMQILGETLGQKRIVPDDGRNDKINAMLGEHDKSVQIALNTTAAVSGLYGNDITKILGKDGDISRDKLVSNIAGNLQIDEPKLLDALREVRSKTGGLINDDVILAALYRGAGSKLIRGGTKLNTDEIASYVNNFASENANLINAKVEHDVLKQDYQNSRQAVDELQNQILAVRGQPQNDPYVRAELERLEAQYAQAVGNVTRLGNDLEQVSKGMLAQGSNASNGVLGTALGLGTKSESGRPTQTTPRPDNVGVVDNYLKNASSLVDPESVPLENFTKEFIKSEQARTNQLNKAEEYLNSPKARLLDELLTAAQSGDIQLTRDQEKEVINHSKMVQRLNSEINQLSSGSNIVEARRANELSRLAESSEGKIVQSLLIKQSRGIPLNPSEIKRIESYEKEVSKLDNILRGY